MDTPKKLSSEEFDAILNGNPWHLVSNLMQEAGWLDEGWKSPNGYLGSTYTQEQLIKANIAMWKAVSRICNSIYETKDPTKDDGLVDQLRNDCDPLWFALTAESHIKFDSLINEMALMEEKETPEEKAKAFAEVEKWLK